MANGKDAIFDIERRQWAAAGKCGFDFEMANPPFNDFLQPVAGEMRGLTKLAPPVQELRDGKGDRK